MKDLELIPGDILFIKMNGAIQHIAIVSAGRTDDSPCIILHYPGRVAPLALAKRYLYPSELMRDKNMTLEAVRPVNSSKSLAALQILNSWLAVQPINDEKRRAFLQTSNEGIASKTVGSVEARLNHASDAFNLTSFALLKFSARGNVPHQIQDDYSFSKGFHCVSGIMIALQLPYIPAAVMTVVPNQLVSDKYPDMQDLAQFYDEDQLSRLRELKITNKDPIYLQYLQVLQTGRFNDITIGKPANPAHGVYFSSRHYCQLEPKEDILSHLPNGLRYEARLMTPEMFFDAVTKDADNFKHIGSLGSDDTAAQVPDSLETSVENQSNIGAETRQVYKKSQLK